MEGHWSSRPETMKKVHIKSFGCQMNVYDGQRMADIAEPSGLCGHGDARGRGPGPAQHLPYPRAGRQKVYSELGRLRDLKAEREAAGPETMIGVAGCVAQAEGGEIHRAGSRPSTSSSARRPITACPRHLAQGAASASRSSRPTTADRGQVRAPAEADAAPRSVGRGVTGLPHRAGRLRQVLHLLRGALYARLRSLAPVAQIVAEAEKLAEAGVRERDAARPERQRLARRGPGRQRIGARPADVPRWPKSPASRGCATPPAIRATWTTS